MNRRLVFANDVAIDPRDYAQGKQARLHNRRVAVYPRVDGAGVVVEFRMLIRNPRRVQIAQIPISMEAAKALVRCLSFF